MQHQFQQKAEEESDSEVNTPVPVQLENWLKVVANKKSNYVMRSNAIMHLTNIRNLIDYTLGHERKSNENMSSRRHSLRSEKRF